MQLLIIVVSTICITLFSCHCTEMESFQDFTDVDTDASELLENAQNYTNRLKILKKTVPRILSKISRLHGRFNVTEHQAIDEIRGYISDNKLFRFAEYVDAINTLYQQFIRYTGGANFENSTIESFARAVLSEGYYLLPLNQMYEFVQAPVEGSSESLFHLLIKQKELNDRQGKGCGRPRSLREQVYRMYKAIALYMAKGYTMKISAYGLLKKLNNKSVAQEIRDVRNKHDVIMAAIKHTVLGFVSQTPQDMELCGPEGEEEQ